MDFYDLDGCAVYTTDPGSYDPPSTTDDASADGANECAPVPRSSQGQTDES